jgi:hypothetical protein
MAFYGNLIKCDRYLQILRFLDFCNNKKDPDNMNDSYDQVWKMRKISDKLNDSYAKYYSPTEHLRAYEINALLDARIIFKQCILK